MGTTVTATAARGQLFGLIARVNDDADVVTITSKAGDAVLVSASEWAQIAETLHVASLPNAGRMLADIRAIAAGDTSQLVRAELIDADKIA
ncbi:type II toxin-antitoxin system Phd/YefM family antitoxin [Antribacter gilvus]|uniref:type II toxin-antitoxin system Phd/YefM family antitoxin n=1 Tax=Antribacter gilvus TaxID=2304675 RepID=UPI0013E0AB28|nr:type II toxin-antitoxin system prevent-host-death family antitoxin [Antribacter gilvus]